MCVLKATLLRFCTSNITPHNLIPFTSTRNPSHAPRTLVWTPRDVLAQSQPCLSHFPNVLELKRLPKEAAAQLVLASTCCLFSQYQWDSVVHMLQELSVAYCKHQGMLSYLVDALFSISNLMKKAQLTRRMEQTTAAQTLKTLPTYASPSLSVLYRPMCIHT